MYDKLRSMQKMLRDQILKFEKLNKKHRALQAKASQLASQNENLKAKVNESFEQIQKLTEALEATKSKSKNKRRTNARSRNK